MIKSMCVPEVRSESYADVASEGLKSHMSSLMDEERY